MLSLILTCNREFPLWGSKATAVAAKKPKTVRIAIKTTEKERCDAIEEVYVHPDLTYIPLFISQFVLWEIFVGYEGVSVGCVWEETPV